MKIEQYSQHTDKHPGKDKATADDPALRFLDEVRQMQDFGRGIAHGALTRADELSGLLIHPDVAFRTMVKNVGESMVVADDYYHNTRPAQVVNDAQSAFIEFGNALTDYAHKSPAERGAICGSAALDVMLAEVTAFGLAKSTLEAGEALGPAALQSRSTEDFERLLASIKYGAGAEFSTAVSRMMASLPDSLRDFASSHEIQVVPVSTMSEVDSRCTDVQGMFMLRSGKPYIFVAEDLLVMKDGGINFDRLALTLRHELTHAVDALTLKNRWLSDIPAVKAIFEAEFNALQRAHQQMLMETIGNGSRKTLRREVVAELVSRNAVPTGTRTDHYFFERFPRLHEALHSPNSPFLAK